MKQTPISVPASTENLTSLPRDALSEARRNGGGEMGLIQWGSPTSEVDPPETVTSSVRSNAELYSGPACAWGATPTAAMAASTAASPETARARIDFTSASMWHPCWYASR